MKKDKVVIDLKQKSILNLITFKEWKKPQQIKKPEKNKMNKNQFLKLNQMQILIDLIKKLNTIQIRVSNLILKKLIPLKKQSKLLNNN